jgi:hypothetical protein
MPHLMTIEQVIESRPYLTPRQLRRFRQQRTVRTYTVARKVLFDVDDLDRFVESTRVDAVVAR